MKSRFVYKKNFPLYLIFAFFVFFVCGDCFFLARFKESDQWNCKDHTIQREKNDVNKPSPNAQYLEKIVGDSLRKIKRFENVYLIIAKSKKL